MTTKRRLSTSKTSKTIKTTKTAVRRRKPARTQVSTKHTVLAQALKKAKLSEKMALNKLNAFIKRSKITIESMRKTFKKKLILSAKTARKAKEQIVQKNAKTIKSLRALQARELKKLKSMVTKTPRKTSRKTKKSTARKTVPHHAGQKVVSLRRRAKTRHTFRKAA